MSYKHPRDYLQGNKRPRMWPPGHKPNEMSLKTKHKKPEYGGYLLGKAIAKRQRRTEKQASAPE